MTRSIVEDGILRWLDGMKPVLGIWVKLLDAEQRKRERDMSIGSSGLSSFSKMRASHMYM